MLAYRINHIIWNADDLMNRLPWHSRFLVGECKSFAGRESKSEGDAIGRPISVAWFERAETLLEGVCVSIKGLPYSDMICSFRVAHSMASFDGAR